ncbi:MAG: nucleoside triphosphate pyrophosphatase [Myxococcota bacterium]
MMSTPAVPRLVLASTSPYRRQVLERLGLPFAVARPDFDERQPLPPGVDTIAATALHLAHGKARAVASLPEHADAWVIGSDQICELDGEILHKPGDHAAAQAQLARLQGRAHRLVTAVAIHAPHGQADAVDVHTLLMRPLTTGQIAAYLAADEPYDCAGSYRIERRGVALFARIDADPECADDSAIMGLPLWKTVRALGRLGFDLLGP